MNTVNTNRNCTAKIKEPCPRFWEQLSETDSPRIRHCELCQHEVYFCSTDSEAVEHAIQGHCIAKTEPDVRGLRTIRLGKPTLADPKLSTEHEAVLAEFRREADKSHALRDLRYASRFCPECSYPVSDWLRTCRVCGLAIGRASTSTATHSETTQT